MTTAEDRVAAGHGPRADENQPKHRRQNDGCDVVKPLRKRFETHPPATAAALME